MDGGGALSFGARLRRLREEAGLTQEELAERAGLSVRGISDLERGVNRSARRATAVRFADAFGLRGEERRAFLTAAQGRPPSPRIAAGRLPTPPTPLIGREGELQTILRLLADPAVRLVTLTGVGGTGKTRLALAAAARVTARYPDGVYFVDLAPLRDATLVAAAIAQVLELEERPRQTPVDAIAAALAGKRALLLDNFEHLLSAAYFLPQLLAHCPHLTVLVTSRAPLAVRGEHAFAIPPLPVPAADRQHSAAALLENEAVTLFVARVSAVSAAFAPGPENAATMAEICRRLDGLPLAIELAAARVPLLSPAAIATRLEDRLTLLTAGPRDLPARQRTLRDAIDWSYQLLDEEQRRLLRRLAVFAGGATLEAIEWVADGVGSRESEGGRREAGGGRRKFRRARPSGSSTSSASSASSASSPPSSLPPFPPSPATRHPPPAILDAVAALVDWGFLWQETERSGEPRLRMLETIREYARERLAEHGELAETRRGHARYFLALAERAEPELTGPDQAAWLAVLDAERDNLRTALSWAIGEGDGETALRLAGALWWFWETRGSFAEGQSWLERALAAGERADTRLRAVALRGAGALAYRRRDLGHSEERLTAALALYRAAGDAGGAAWCLAFLGLAALVRGELNRAAAYHAGALAAARESGDRLAEAGSLSNLGEVAHMQGDLARAEALYEESLHLEWELQNHLIAARSQTNLAVLALERGQPGRAAGFHREALQVYLEVGDRRGIASSLEGAAAVAAARGDGYAAAHLYAAAAALREMIGSPVPAVERAMHVRGLAAARSLLDDSSFARTRADDEAVDINAAIAAAQVILGHSDGLG